MSDKIHPSRVRGFKGYRMTFDKLMSLQWGIDIADSGMSDDDVLGYMRVYPLAQIREGVKAFGKKYGLTSRKEFHSYG